MKYAISELDIFYISYDEPNADETYNALCSMAPCEIKRVHGVKGFDKAHKTCAEQSDTRRFVTIDGDNMAHGSLFFQRVDDADEKDLVFSFKAKNMVNGLEYGNGGVKVWPRNLVLQHSTHEAAARGSEASTDFCWTFRYLQVDHLASFVSYGSAKQAFRAGYREAIKLSLVDGNKLDSWEETAERAWPTNLKRLFVWASVGADAEWGQWAMFGARAGLADMWIENEAVLDLITDYDAFDRYFEKHYAWQEPLINGKMLGSRINRRLGTTIAELDEDQSRWFKSVYVHPSRSGIMLPQMAPVEFDDD